MFKRLFKIAPIVAVSIFFSSQTYAIIPVEDAASLAQEIESYSQDLLNYKQYIEQTALNDSQLANALEQYNQMLTDYQQVLTQAKALSTEFNNLDLDSLLSDLADLDELSPYYNQDDPDAAESDSDYSTAEDKNAYLNKFSTNVSDWEDDTSSINYTSKSATRAKENFVYLRNKATNSVQQMTAQQKYADDLKTQGEKIDSVADDLDSIDDNDIEKTLNVIARQNQILLGQILTQEAMLNSQASSQNQLATTYYNNLAARQVAQDKITNDAY